MVKCQMGVCRADESEDSPDSCKNGQLQILVSERVWLEVLNMSSSCPGPLSSLTFGKDRAEFWMLQALPAELDDFQIFPDPSHLQFPT